MGLFGNSKKEENKMPPAPPAPPAPPLGNQDQNANIGQTMPKEVQKLSTPPVPGSSSLDDIKNEVSAIKPKQEDLNQNQDNNDEIDHEEEFDINKAQDSLFDLSELDIPQANNFEEENKDETEHEENEHKESSEDGETLNFIEKQSHKVQSNETYFITTKQFKNLLEIVEGVKNKVKEASETHLKLLDIKAEEDIEYENLKKDFEFIEDKLHEVDSIIFEN